MPHRFIVRGQQVELKKLERARELRREMTSEERLLWQRLRNEALSGLHFRRQQVIDGFIVDFYCHSAGLVVEVDGIQHEAQADYDRERDRILRVLRIATADVRNSLEAVLSLITSEAQLGL
ncbi:MAG TPA: DUF559 domain-containing protein [Dehalococcoidia bacterium]|nr:DUF559 domain-containing protein [Dehalococcoidia bacterium]